MTRIKIRNDEDIKAEILRIITGMKRTKWEYNQSIYVAIGERCGCFLGYRAYQRGMGSGKAYMGMGTIMEEVYSFGGEEVEEVRAMETWKKLYDLYGKGHTGSFLAQCQEFFGIEYRDLVEKRLRPLRNDIK